MIALTLAEIADALGARLAAGAQAGHLVDHAVVADSRLVAPGDLFVAVQGDRVDGHDYAAAAVADGAVAVLASRELDVPCIVVADTVEALGRLARWVIDRHPDLVVVALTGSSGKTSTKDLLAQVLPAFGPTVAPQGSFNTEVGLPLTALTIEEETRALVMEMGARGAGHIRYLCGIAPPRVGLVLNVGSAHVGEFGSPHAIAEAKGELVEALPAADAGGVAVLNGDDQRVRAMSSRTAARVVLYGQAPDCDVRASDVVLDASARPSFLLHVGEDSAPVTMSLHGRHHVSNALAVAAVATSLGIGTAAVASALTEARPASRWRMEVTETPSGVTVVNDAYNANPESVLAALEAVEAMARRADRREARRTVAVLGEMRELGELSIPAHEQVGAAAVASGFGLVVAVGTTPAVQALADAARSAADDEGRAVVVADVPDAVELLRRELSAGDVVLVKASRAAGLERIAFALTEVTK